MNRIAVFPGSFDPFTLGHESIVNHGLKIFDKIVVAIGSNSSKKTLFSLEKRKELIYKIFDNNPRVEVGSFEGLTIDFCKQVNANFLLRGLRTSADFEFERAIAQVNKTLWSEIETVFLLTAPELSAVSSTIVREVWIHKGPVRQFVPEAVALELEKMERV